jgi:3'-phosphoadenosine 5'-phosphosulfate (PAPS) 3'-phosphatase
MKNNSDSNRALEILETLLPHLRASAEYAAHIQKQIAHQPDKSAPDGNHFAAALSDADISIQTAIEVAVLSAFPNARFFGEEYASSVNTKYLAGTWLQEEGEDWVFLLDPIDGTRYYLDQGEFQVIFSIASPTSFEASIFLFPRRKKILYAVRGKGAFIGEWSEKSLRNYETFRMKPAEAPVFFSRTRYSNEGIFGNRGLFDLERDYRPGLETPIYTGLFFGELSSVVMSGGQLIDGAAAAFIAGEAGAIVTTHTGEPLPEPRSAGPSRAFGGLVISDDVALHQDILKMLSE